MLAPLAAKPPAKPPAADMPSSCMSKPCARPVEFWYAWIAPLVAISSFISSKPSLKASLPRFLRPALVVSCLAARWPASFSDFLIAFLLSCAMSRLKICWMASRVAAIRPAAAGEAAPRVSATATAMPISSIRKRPISIQASSLAPSMSQPHSSTSLPSSSAIARSELSGAFSSAESWSQAPLKACAPAPPYPESTSPAA
ncbi:hypothetical protein DMB66_15045 [Actinoplanes sp. ATCC 53533]|uniref:hypothetical protein n=1 Tax=Actinoplanes sp. ATCC 53533 TaxID=1288362 RepID=UPI0010036B6B|nr:hypothetical protein [Actinoplanes sp. ATCC 53533]RSM67772.1 hypothetical protein DMB66_15045 [Actinoplanes sp. ATCC 53533]